MWYNHADRSVYHYHEIRLTCFMKWHRPGVHSCSVWVATGTDGADVFATHSVACIIMVISVSHIVDYCQQLLQADCKSIGTFNNHWILFWLNLQERNHQEYATSKHWCTDQSLSVLMYDVGHVVLLLQYVPVFMWSSSLRLLVLAVILYVPYGKSLQFTVALYMRLKCTYILYRWLGTI